jgi:hypothetical protein
VLTRRNITILEFEKCLAEIQKWVFGIYDQYISPKGFPKPYLELEKDIEEYKQRRDIRLEKQRRLFVGRYKEHLSAGKKTFWNMVFSAIAAITGIIGTLAVIYSWFNA